MDATTVLDRKITELGIYPAVDPLASTSRILDPHIVGQEHYDVAQRVKQILQRNKELQDIISILGMEELSEEDKTGREPRAPCAAFPFAAVCRSRTVYRRSGRDGGHRGYNQRIQE